MSDHLLSQSEIDAMVKAGAKKGKSPAKQEVRPPAEVVKKLFTALEPKLGEALGLLTANRAVTFAAECYVKKGAEVDDKRYVISLGSTEEQVEVLIFVDEQAASSILKKISEEPERTEEYFTASNMEVFGKVIEVLADEFSAQTSDLAERRISLSVALPKGLSSLQEFLDSKAEYVVLKYNLEWNEDEVGMLGFVMKNDDVPLIFPDEDQQETVSSIDDLIEDSNNGQDEDIFAHLMNELSSEEEPAEEVVVKPVQFGNLKGGSKQPVKGEDNLEIILDLPVMVTVELGRTKKSLEEILNLKPGSVVELDRLAGEPVDVLANGVLIAKGEVVVIDETFGVKITEIASRKQRINRIK